MSGIAPLRQSGSPLYDSGDRIEILWDGGVTTGIYADHRDGGRVIVDVPGDGPTLMLRTEFGRSRLRIGVGERWGSRLDQFYELLLNRGDVDDTTREAAHAQQ